MRERFFLMLTVAVVFLAGTVTMFVANAQEEPATDESSVESSEPDAEQQEEAVQEESTAEEAPPPEESQEQEQHGDEEHEAALLSGNVCPISKWADHGSYCSYYAMTHETCSPTNIDASCSITLAANCLDTANCFPTVEKRDGATLNAEGEIAANGYSGDKLTEGQDSLIPTEATALGEYLVQFSDVHGNPRFAKIIVAEVTPTTSGMVTAILSAGFEIEPPDEGSTITRIQVRPEPGMPHVYAANLGSAKASIITHEDTPGHKE